MLHYSMLFLRKIIFCILTTRDCENELVQRDAVAGKEAKSEPDLQYHDYCEHTEYVLCLANLNLAVWSR